MTNDYIWLLSLFLLHCIIHYVVMPPSTIECAISILRVNSLQSLLHTFIIVFPLSLFCIHIILVLQPSCEHLYILYHPYTLYCGLV